MSISNLYSKRIKKPNLYNIQAIDNIASIMQHGLLCYERAKSLDNHISVALESVQNRRDLVIVPNGMPLHKYANLYFDYWNPMLSRVRSRNEDICILAFDISVLDIVGAIVTDRNASTSLTNFFKPEEGLEELEFDLIYERYWVDENHYVDSNKKAIKCAEVLIPDMIPKDYIKCAVVYNQNAVEKLKASGFDKEIIVYPSAFF